MVDVDARRSGGRARLALWSTLLAVLALAAFTWWMDVPPAPLPLDAPSAMFSAQRATSHLEELVGDGQPHPLASAADARIRGQIVARLQALGIPTELQSGWACNSALACGRVVNIIGRIAGTEPDSGTVLLASHYDSVPAGPGAGDDGIGVASVLEIARALRQQAPLRHPIILLIDEGEETGLLGARLFAAEHPAARAVRAVVNLDARGDTGPSLMFETGPATDWTLRLYARAVARPMSNSLYYFVYKLLPNDTDFTVFKAAGYEGLNYALIGDVERYHTPQDTIANLDRRSLQHQGQNALASVRALAAASLEQPGSRGAVFFDFMGRTLLHWPVSWSAPLGIALALALVYALAVVKRRARVEAGELLHAFGAWLLAWLVVTGAAVALLSLARATGSVPPASIYAWAAHPSGMHVASLALALLAPALAVRLSRRRAGPWSLWMTHALVVGALAVVCCLEFPEPSFVFLVPALAMLMVAWPAASAARRAATDGVPTIVVVLPLLVTTLVFAPILLLLYPGLGAEAWPVLTAVAALGLMGLAPLLRQAQVVDLRAWAWLGALGVVLGGALTMLRPAYSTQMPQRTLLWYLLDADTGRARWMLQPDSKRHPPQLALREPEVASAASLPSGTIAGPHVAAAPQLEYAPPELQVQDAAAVEGGSRHRLHLRSMRGAPEIELALPDGEATAATLIDPGGRRLPIKPWRAADHSLWLKFIGAPAEGVDVELETPGTQHLVVTLLDRSYGLPAAGAALRRPGPALTTASQDGDLTVVYRSYALGRPQAAAEP